MVLMCVADNETAAGSSTAPPVLDALDSQRPENHPEALKNGTVGIAALSCVAAVAVGFPV